MSGVDGACALINIVGKGGKSILPSATQCKVLMEGTEEFHFIRIRGIREADHQGGFQNWSVRQTDRGQYRTSLIIKETARPTKQY